MQSNHGSTKHASDTCSTCLETKFPIHPAGSKARFCSFSACFSPTTGPLAYFTFLVNIEHSHGVVYNYEGVVLPKVWPAAGKVLATVVDLRIQIG